MYWFFGIEPLIPGFPGKLRHEGRFGIATIRSIPGKLSELVRDHFYSVFDKLSQIQNTIIVNKEMLGKGNIASYQHFLLFPHFFFSHPVKDMPFIFH